MVPDADPRVHVLLLDHDNVEQSGVGLLTLIHTWIDSAGTHLQATGVMSLLVRAYGGWFQDTRTSPARIRASEFYQEATPSILRRNGRYYSLSFEFADHLAASTIGAGLADPMRITHTVARRAAALQVKILNDKQQCTEPDCELKATKKWIRKKRACTRISCPVDFRSAFERTEQKQVDVHLALDLLEFLKHTTGQVALASDDADLLPAVALALLNGVAQDRLTLLRCGEGSSYLDGAARAGGVRIAQVIGIRG
jgi:hypothetical protein